jgi:hypothetical protein
MCLRAGGEAGRLSLLSGRAPSHRPAGARQHPSVHPSACGGSRLWFNSSPVNQEGPYTLVRTTACIGPAIAHRCVRFSRHGVGRWQPGYGRRVLAMRTRPSTDPTAHPTPPCRPVAGPGALPCGKRGAQSFICSLVSLRRFGNGPSCSGSWLNLGQAGHHFATIKEVVVPELNGHRRNRP